MASMADMLKRERSGWVVVSALLLVMTVCHGVITSGLPALDTTLLESLDISRADLKLRESIFLMASGLSGLGIGFLTARVAPRTIVLSGLGLLAIALALYGHAQTIGQIGKVFGASAAFPLVVHARNPILLVTTMGGLGAMILLGLYRHRRTYDLATA